MTDTVIKLPSHGDGPRRAFVTAWHVWVRDTAKQLVEAGDDFEEVTAILAELRVAHNVIMSLVVGATAEAEEIDQ
jgi:hypothetical protein